MTPDKVIWALVLVVCASWGIVYLAGLVYPKLREKGVFNPFDSVIMTVFGVVAFWAIYLQGYMKGRSECCEQGSDQNNVSLNYT